MLASTEREAGCYAMFKLSLNNLHSQCLMHQCTQQSKCVNQSYRKSQGVLVKAPYSAARVYMKHIVQNV